MSCFCGRMNIYKDISIDCFDGNNLDSSTFFLSHCHSDHMSGLDSEVLKNKLQSFHYARFYMSEVTKILLLEDKRYYYLKPFIHALPIEEPKVNAQLCFADCIYCTGIYILYIRYGTISS